MIVKEITVQELKNKIETKEDFQLIDVREKDEQDICQIGGELIPLGTLMDNTDKIATDKMVVIHCKSGGRSGRAVEMLQDKLKLENLYNLKGGILAWAREIDPSVKQY